MPDNVDWILAKVECEATLSLVTHTKEPYRKIRKAYTRSDGTKVKRKAIIRMKSVKLKQPVLHGDIRLIVHDKLFLGGIYTDGTEHYFCDRVTDISGPLSYLRNVSVELKDGKFVTPKCIRLFGITQRES